MSLLRKVRYTIDWKVINCFETELLENIYYRIITYVPENRFKVKDFSF